MAAEFRAIRDVELALHVSVVGDAVAPFIFPRSLRLSISVGSGKAMLTTSDERSHSVFPVRPGPPGPEDDFASGC